MKAYRETVDCMYTDPAVAEDLRRLARHHGRKGHSARATDFFRAKSIDPDKIVGLDPIVNDAVDAEIHRDAAHQGTAGGVDPEFRRARFSILAARKFPTVISGALVLWRDGRAPAQPKIRLPAIAEMHRSCVQCRWRAFGGRHAARAASALRSLTYIERNAANGAVIRSIKCHVERDMLGIKAIDA